MARSTVYARGIRTRIAAAQKDTPVVLVNGPRQAGKTTLIRQYASDRRPYLTLDDSATLQTARDDPQGFIQRLDTVVIDEVQRVPELLLAIKLSVGRRHCLYPTTFSRATRFSPISTSTTRKS